jgi:hypothetical protein
MRCRRVASFQAAFGIWSSSPFQGKVAFSTEQITEKLSLLKVLLHFRCRGMNLVI